MPRDITVTFADGTTAQYKNAPDDVTPEQVTQRAQREYGGQVVGLDGGKKAGGDGIVDQVLRKLDVAGSGFMRGLASLPALAGDAANFVGNNLPGVLNPFDLGMRAAGATPEQVEESKVRGMPLSAANAAAGVQPKTPGEKYLAAAAEGVGGALAGPGVGVAPVRNALVGAGAGLGAEAGGQLSGDSFLGRLAGGLVGGGAVQVGAGLVTRLRPQSADLAREAVEGLSPETLKAAQAFQAKAASSGITMDLAQALEAVGAPSSNLATLRDVLANSRHGNAVQGALRGQQQELELLSDVTVAGLPGPVWGQGPAANAVQEAATGVINAAKQERGNAVKALYAQAGELTEDGRNAILKRLDDLMKRPGNTEGFTNAIKEMQGKLAADTSGQSNALQAALTALQEAPKGSAKARAALAVRKAAEDLRNAKAAPVHALDADTMVNDVVRLARGTPLSPTDPKTAGQLKHLAGQVNQELQTQSPAIARAEEVFSQISRDKVNPLKQSVIGQLAGNRGYLEDVQAPVSRLEAIFSKGSDAQVAEAARDIPKMFNELRNVDPNAAPAAAKAFIRARMDRAFASAPGDVIPGAVSSVNSAKLLKDSLFATRAQEQGMRDIAVGIARSYGLDEVEVARGLSHFMQITKGLASRPEKVGGLNWGDVAKAGGKSSLADMARLYGFMPFARVASKIEDATLAKTFQQFDKILTSPEGADLLITLSRTPNMSDKAVLALAQFGATVGAVPPEKLE